MMTIIDEQRIAERGRWVAEFASVASLAQLEREQAAGQHLIDSLLAERHHLFTQLHNAIALRNSLATAMRHDESTSLTA
jgi:hypothetical protein